MRMFLGEISFWLGGLSKVDGPLLCDSASSNPLRASTEKKAEERGVSFFPASLLKLGHLISSSPFVGLRFTPLAPLVLRPSNSD